MTLSLLVSRPHSPKVPGAKEGHHERAETHEHPFEDDIRPFRGKFEQKSEADNKIKKSPTER
jgi:hypothetical protein